MALGTRPTPEQRTAPSRRARVPAARALLLCATLWSVAQAGLAQAQAADAPGVSVGISAGVSARPLADATEIGLPAYPGATPLREGDGDGPGASLGLWAGAFGIEMQVLKLRTPDSVDAVARYYRDAMSRMGRVVDCGTPETPDTPAAAAPAASENKLLRCDGDRPKRGGRVFKLALPGGVRMVTIEPRDGATRVQLLRLAVRGD